MVVNHIITTQNGLCISGALSKNRTCDSSLPRTCFTTRLLGQQNFPNYNLPHIKSKNKKSQKNRPKPEQLNKIKDNSIDTERGRYRSVQTLHEISSRP